MESPARNRGPGRFCSVTDTGRCLLRLLAFHAPHPSGRLPDEMPRDTQDATSRVPQSCLLRPAPAPCPTRRGAPSTPVTRPFPSALDRDTIPIACRPPVCACLSRPRPVCVQRTGRRRQVRPVCRACLRAARKQVGTGRHAQAGRFSSTAFIRRARPSGRWAVLRGARRIKPYSLGTAKDSHHRKYNHEPIPLSLREGGG